MQGLEKTMVGRMEKTGDIERARDCYSDGASFLNHVPCTSGLVFLYLLASWF